MMRGVTLYSYQEEYYQHAMTLEDCLAEDDPWLGLTGFLERTMVLITCDRGLSELLAGSADARDRVAETRARIAPKAEVLLRRLDPDEIYGETLAALPGLAGWTAKAGTTRTALGHAAHEAADGTDIDPGGADDATLAVVAKLAAFLYFLHLVR